MSTIPPETNFERVAIILGARLFKKYWPVRGSFWNKTHMKKTQLSLQTIIDEADAYTHIHAREMAIQFIVLPLLWIFGTETFGSTARVVGAFAVIHSYAFMIHKYNRVIANRALGKLKKEEGEKDEEKEVDPLEGLALSLHGNSQFESGKYYTIRVRESYYQIGPVFMQRDKAIAFAKKLCADFNIQEIINLEYQRAIPAYYYA